MGFEHWQKIESTREKNSIFYSAVRPVGSGFFLDRAAVSVGGALGLSLTIPGINPTMILLTHARNHSRGKTTHDGGNATAGGSHASRLRGLLDIKDEKQ